MRSLTVVRRSTVFAGALITTLSTALVLGLLTAPAANALLRWTTYDAGRTAQIGVPDSQVLLEHDGVRTLVWAAEGRILARRSTADGWTEPSTIAKVASDVRLAGAVDSQGVVTVAWVQPLYRSTTIRTARFDSRWSEPVVAVADARADSVPEVGLSLVTVNDVPCLVASIGALNDPTRPRQVTVRTFDGSQWIEQAAPPGLSERPGTAQAFASERFLGVTWTQDPAGQAVVDFLNPSTGEWSATTVVATTMPLSAAPLVAVGADDTGTTSALVWGSSDPATATRMWRYALVDGATVGEPLTLAVGMPNSARPAATWTGGSLWVTGSDPQSLGDRALVWARGLQVVDETVSTPGLVMNSVSMAADGSGRPLLSWLSSDPGRSVSLDVAHRVDGAWVSELSLPDARAGGVVSQAAPSVLWQRVARSGVRADVVVSSFEDVPLGVPTLQKLRLKDGPVVTARWQAPSDSAGVTGYVVQVRRGKGAWVSRPEVGSGVRSFSFRATHGATYRVRVAALGNGERSAWSDVKVASVPKKPRPPRR